MCASDLIRSAAILLALAVALPAGAQDKKPDPAREALRRMQVEQRKLEQEKSRLSDEKAAAEVQVKAVSAKAEAARRQAAEAAKKLAALEQDLAAVQAERDALTTKLAESEQQLAKISEQHRATEAERLRLDGVRVRLEASVAGQKQTIGVCEDRNARLHAVGLDLLEKYRTKGCFDSALQNEPFTGLRQVEIENAIEDGRDKLDELRIEATNRE